MSVATAPPASPKITKGSLEEGVSPSPSVTPPSPVSFNVQVLQHLEELQQHREAWQTLVRQALEPNPFFEPWFFEPAMRWLKPPPTLRIVLIYRHHPPHQPELIAFYPLCQLRWGRWPVTVWTNWQHPYHYYSAPLIHRHRAAEAWEQLWSWMTAQESAHAWELTGLCVDSSWGNLLRDWQFRHQPRALLVEQHQRAIFYNIPPHDTPWYATMSKHTKHELERLRRRLNEKAALQVLSSDREPFAPTDDFLQLEAQGWKGREGTAIARDPQHAAFFQEMTHRGLATGRVHWLGLQHAQRLVALKLNFVTPPHSFAFKIAYDETLSKYSPGTLLECDNITWLRQHSELSWMDSCAKPGHPMIERLWHDRRVVQHWLFPLGPGIHECLLSCHPLWASLKGWWASWKSCESKTFPR
ncbi:MAG: hypothetical protein KatS3mg113_0984 [Planctomycetaceae bacterium]|nr:MAG: hypothetical protein KatS3mg113_0984 [Planctomycetaceae bacterium]